MKTILIIGSSGFIGKKLKNKLKKNNNLLCPSKILDLILKTLKKWIRIKKRLMLLSIYQVKFLIKEMSKTILKGNKNI